MALRGGGEKEGKTITWLEKADAFDLTDHFTKAFLIFILSASFNQTPVAILAQLESCFRRNHAP